MDKAVHSSGILTYVTDILVSKRHTDLESPNCDAMWIEIKCERNTILLSNVYRVPNIPVFFWTYFNILVEKAINEGKSVVIVGDINKDQLNCNNKHLKHVYYII